MCYIKMGNIIEAIKFLNESASINKNCYDN